jgi:beta-phosphoglucomutase
MNLSPDTLTTAVIFDCDGVLVDSEPLHRIAWERTYGRRGVVVPEVDYAWSIGRRDITFAEIIAKRFGLSDSGPDLVTEKRGHLIRMIAEESNTFSGLPELVARLALSRHLGIASSAMRREIGLATQRFGLERYFNVIVSNEDVTHHKPDPEPYLLCAERLGIPPDRCVVFEDSVSGIRSAKTAGMSVVAFTSTFPAEELAEADAVIDSLAETDKLVDLVQSLESKPE